MCFSAGASISAGVLLTVIGIETLRKVQKPSQTVFATIPLFFASQQFMEGIVWLTLPNKEFVGLQRIATTSFLIMAQVIWPIMVPLAVLLMEKNKARKRILVGLLIAGLAVSLFYSYTLLFYHAYAKISHFHIQYKNSFFNPYNRLTVALYLSATLVPLFVSSVKRTQILGFITGLSFLVSLLFFTKYVISVWCFFAAIISFVIYYILKDEHTIFKFRRLEPPLSLVQEKK